MNLSQLAQSRMRFWPAELFRDGSIGLFTCSDAALLSTDAAGTTPVTASGDYIGKHLDLSGNGYHFTQGTSTARFQFFGNYYKLDLTDDVMSTTLPAIASGTVVVMTSKGTWFDSFSCAAGAFNWGPSTYTGGRSGLFTALREGANDCREIGRIVINRALTANEKAQVIAWAKSRSGNGGITLGPEMVTNGFPTTDSGWTKGDGWSISAGNYFEHTATPIATSCYQNIGAQIGKNYAVSFNILQSNSACSLRIGNPTTGVGFSIPSGSIGEMRGIVFLESGNTFMYLTSTANNNLRVRSISCREVIFP